MSSFICSTKHFNTVEKNLIDLCNDRTLYHYPTQINKMMQAMRQITVKSYFNQYANHYPNIEAEIKAANYELGKITKVNKLPLIAIFKALNCINYQIETPNEEMTPDELKQFLLFEEISAAIAKKIVQNLDAYDMPQWEIN